MSHEKLSDEAIDALIDKEARYTQKRDPDDPRFDIVTARVPNGSIMHPDAKVPAECELTGKLARLRYMRMILATAAGLADQMGADPVVKLGLGAMFQDAQLMEQLALVGDETEDVNQRLALAAASGKKSEA